MREFADRIQVGQKGVCSWQDTKEDTQQLLDLVAQIVPYHMSHNAGGLLPTNSESQTAVRLASRQCLVGRTQRRTRSSCWTWSRRSCPTTCPTTQVG